MIPDPRVQPTVPLWPTVGEALGIGRAVVYDLAKRGELPVKVITCGRRRLVATAELCRLLALEDPDEDANGP